MFRHPILKFIFSTEVMALWLVGVAAVNWFYYHDRMDALLFILLAITVLLSGIHKELTK